VEVTLRKREVRRSFALNVFNGTVFEFAERLIDPPLVLTWFVSQLTTSNLLIGLVAPLGNAGWFLPQLFVSARIQRMERKMPSYTAAAVIRTLSWVLLATTVWLVDDALLLLVGFFVLYTIARLMSGLAGLSFFDVTAKTIPAQRRGSLFAWRQFLGGLLGMGAGWIVKVVLNHPGLPFPQGHALLFALYWAAMIPALGAFMFIREPPGKAVEGQVSVGNQLRRAGRLIGSDPTYRQYMGARLALGLAGIALPFYGIYAKSVLGAREGMVGIYVTTRVAAQLVFNLPWGRLSDRYGNRLTMRLQSLGAGLTALLALGLVALVGVFRPEGPWTPYLALPLFVLDGAMRPAQVMTGSNFLLELVPGDERPLYLGLSNTLMGVIVLLSGLGGLVVDLLSFTGLFVLSLTLCLGGYALATGLPEPRHQLEEEEA
jgi:MFS family permease